jgi:lipoprotein-releasing system permease protein
MKSDDSSFFRRARSTLALHDIGEKTGRRPAAIERPSMTEPTATRPFAPFEWMLSLRYLRARRKEGVISVIAAISFVGVMLGVAALIIVMAVMNGFRVELLAKILGLNGHLMVQPLQYPLNDWQQVTDRIAKVPGIKLAMPVVEGQALASSPYGASGVLVRGLRGADLMKLPSIANNIRQGTLAGFDEGQGVAIGRRLADQLSLGAGDSITLVAPRGAQTIMGTVPRIKTYKVAAIFEVGLSNYDAGFLFMPLKEAQAYFNRTGDVSMIEIYTDNPDQIDRYRKLVNDAAGRPVYLVDWRQRDAVLFSALQVERNVMFIVVGLVVLVAVLNIISGLVMLVKDKGHDIAILRTMGATQGAVMRVFVITGASIGVVGTLVGLLVAFAVCRNIEAIRQFLSWLTSTDLFPKEIYFLSHLPADMDTGETVAVVVMALSFSLLATLYPAWRAARLDPVEALRYE